MTGTDGDLAADVTTFGRAVRGEEKDKPEPKPKPKPEPEPEPRPKDPPPTVPWPPAGPIGPFSSWPVARSPAVPGRRGLDNRRWW